MSKLSFAGKTAIVTGAGRGLGRGYALMLAERGCHVVVNDNGAAPDGSAQDAGPADGVVEEIRRAGGSAAASVEDVVTGADAIVARALETSGRLDILVNNAGSVAGGPFDATAPEVWDRLVQIHLGGTVAVCRAAWKHLVEHKGVVCNMGSTAMFGGAYVTNYSAAKGAIFSFSRSLAGEGKLVGVRVNTVLPNAYTRLTAQLPNPKMLDLLSTHFSPERVAAFVTWLCHESCSLNGLTFSVGAGRATRVELVQTPGVDGIEAPEDVADKLKDLLSLDQLTVFADTTEERDYKFAPFMSA